MLELSSLLTFGFYAARQSTELPPLVLYFILSLVIAFFGVFVLLMVSADSSYFEVGVHPLKISVSLFGTEVIAWLFQGGCIHRAWMLIKYKKKMRKILTLNYKRDFNPEEKGFEEFVSHSDIYDTYDSCGSDSVRDFSALNTAINSTNWTDNTTENEQT